MSVKINFEAFAWTSGIGGFLLMLFLLATRARAPRSPKLRAVACALAALSFTPSAIPFALSFVPGVTGPVTIYIHPAVFFILLGFSKNYDWAVSIFGLFPILIVFPSLCGIWDIISERRSASLVSLERESQ